MLTFKWWQTILVGLIILLVGFGGGYGVKTITYKAPIADTVYKAGKTIYVSVPQVPIIGRNQPKVNSVTAPHPTIIDTGYHFDIPLDIHIFDATTDSTLKDSTHVIFKSWTYVYKPDSAEIVHKWVITPKPLIEVSRIDTVFVKQPVPLPIEQPFIFKPGFTYPVGIIIGGVLVYLFTHK